MAGSEKITSGDHGIHEITDASIPLVRARVPGDTHDRLRIGLDGSVLSGSGSSEPSGTFARVLQDFYPEDYGALGNSNGTAGNGHDDTAAINACIVAAGVNGGRVVLGRNRIYRVTGQLLIGVSNVSLVGQGMGVSTIFCDFSTDLPSLLVSTGLYPVGGINTNPTSTLKNIELRDFTITRVAYAVPSLTNSHQIFIWQVSNFVVDKVESSQSNLFGIEVFGLCTDGTISRCHVHDCSRDGIHVQAGASRIAVVNNHVHDVMDDGIALSGDGYLPAHAAAVTECVIKGNTIHNVGSRGIGIIGAQQCNVEGNTIWNTFLPGIYVGAETGFAISSDCLIQNNVIVWAGAYTPANPAGAGMPGCGVYVDPGSLGVQGIIVKNNIIESPQNDFVRVSNEATGGGANVINLVIDGNYCSDVPGTATGGLGAHGSNGGNQPNPNPAHYAGIAVYIGRDVLISNNFIDSSNQEAILVGGTTTGLIQVANNLIVNCNTSATASTYGVAVSVGKAVAIGNICRDPSAHLTGAVNLTGATSVVNANNATTT